MFKPKKIGKLEEQEEFEEEVPTPQFKEQKQNRQPVKAPVQEEQNDWSVQEIPTATTPVIYNARTKETLSLYEAIAEILNRSEN
jgi:hypothetical protein